jgi:flagellar M-ring protein FliF
MTPTPDYTPAPPNRSAFAEFWRSPATTQKIMALGLLVASIAVAGYGLSLALRGAEQMLYRDLPEQEAALIVDRLGTAGLSARLGDDGRSVWIRSASIEQARLALAADGLPGAGVAGFELFDETSFGMTDFLEQVNYRRALEGELARTITALDEVSNARVHLVLPRESVYADESEPAKASVSLRLHRRMQPKSVQAVVHLVASAVEGLTPEGVVVVDSNGRTLHAGSSDPSAEALSGEQLALKSRIEQELAAKAVAILEPLVGDGRVRAKASVDLDFEQAEETVETYDPNGSVIRSQRRDEQREAKGNALLARGIPGTRSNPGDPSATEPNQDSNPDADPDPDPDADQDSSTNTDPNAPAPDDTADGAPAEENAAAVNDGLTVTKSSETTNYEVSRRVRHVTTPTGRVLRQSIAVVVDDQPGGGGEDPAPYPPEEMQKFQQLVVAALGVDVANGDVVTVENISFERQEVPIPEPSGWESVRPYVSPVLRNLSWVAVLLFFYLFLYKPVMRKLSAPMSAASEVLPEVSRSELGAGYAAGALPQAQRSEQNLVEQAQQVSHQSPDAATELVRSWLSQDGQ